MIFRYTLCVLIFAIATILGYSQNQIHGIVVTDRNNALENINVTNLISKKQTVTNEKGMFTIAAELNDAIKISSVQYEDYYIKVDQKTINNNNIVIKLIAKNYELQQVNIVKLDAYKMGIINYKPKQYTVAQRRQYSNSFAGGGLVVGLINAIDGKSKMLKKIVAEEKRYDIIIYLKTVFPDDYVVQNFKIPLEYSNGFRYYASYNQEVVELCKQKKVMDLQFLLTKIAVDYLQTIKE